MKKRRTRTLQSTKYLQKKRKKSFLNISLISLGVLCFLVAFILILRLPSLQISKIEIVGVKTLSADVLSLEAMKSLSGQYVNLIPKTSSLLYSPDDIELGLKSSFKKIASIMIERENVSTLKIKIVESTPEAMVCEGYRDEENQNKCYFLDKNAYIFDDATQISDGVYVKYFTGHTSTTTSIGDYFLDKEKFVQLQNFVETIKSYGIPIAGILVGEAGSFELYVKNQDQSITVVYFDDRTPFDKTSSNFLAFWQNALDHKIGTTTVPIFDYINLRFGNNVFYTTR